MKFYKKNPFGVRNLVKLCAALFLFEDLYNDIWRYIFSSGAWIKIIKFFRYSKRLEPAKKMGMKKGIFAGLGSGVMWFIIYATYALAFWYGVGLILDSRNEEKPIYTPAVLMIVSFKSTKSSVNPCNPWGLAALAGLY